MDAQMSTKPNKKIRKRSLAAVRPGASDHRSEPHRRGRSGGGASRFGYDYRVFLDVRRVCVT